MVRTYFTTGTSKPMVLRFQRNINSEIFWFKRRPPRGYSVIYGFCTERGNVKRSVTPPCCFPFKYLSRYLLTTEVDQWKRRPGVSQKTNSQISEIISPCGLQSHCSIYPSSFLAPVRPWTVCANVDKVWYTLVLLKVSHYRRRSEDRRFREWSTTNRLRYTEDIAPRYVPFLKTLISGVELV